MSSETNPPKVGWGWPSNSKKAHYFYDGRSLCMRWIFFGAVEQGKDDSCDNCVACKKKLAKHRAT
jgi:hypothetical protein